MSQEIAGKVSIYSEGIGAHPGTLGITIEGNDATIHLKNKSAGNDSIVIDGGAEGKISFPRTVGKYSVLNGTTGEMTLYDKNGFRGFALLSKAPSLSELIDTTGLWIGAGTDEGQKAGCVFIRGRYGKESINLDGRTGDFVMHDQEGKRSFALNSQTGDFAGMWIGGSADPTEGPKAGKVFLRDLAGNDSIVLDGVSGDIMLNNADCAEEFDVINPKQTDPGTVLIIENTEKLLECTLAYDKRVAGVVSGGGKCKPGILLGKSNLQTGRKPVALVGKVYCKVDADFGSINVGDMLTTSSTKGHAMKALDPILSFGAILGKALHPLKKGKGLIPILITLH